MIFILFILSTFVTACSSDSTSSSSGNSEIKDTKKQEAKESGKLLTHDEFIKMLSDPKKHKGSKVEFYAKVFVEPEKDEDGTYLQAYADNNSDRNIIIGIGDPNLDVATEDVIFVSGTVEDLFEGENLMGGTVTAPVIKADKIEMTDYATAFAPAIKTVDVNKEINQHDYILKLNKVEIADSETRLYITITNNSKDNISFYSFNSKMVVGNQQFEPEDNYEANYPEIQSDILSGVTSEGIIRFPAIPESGELRILLEGSSENWDLDFTPFEFQINY
ncbi:DUF4352 domain-containing protein [Cytobacillus dafuensis]|uniref:DUF4352 domain-containing protein n=2 Tax=Cytobacillus dafuensis TaxID=1742359 RepID=A0A5B8ZB91_CYTDA|nr:DUF4352 domain-containing protein [Cytobacillus dafuensis]